VTSFEFDVDISASAPEVIKAFWELQSWPALAPHVRAMRVHYDDGVVQVVTMDVLTRGHQTSFKSVRLRSGNCISYIQPEPPPALHAHRGSWTFLTTPGGTTVTCRHEIEVNHPIARDFLAAAKMITAEEQVEERMQDVIKSNSLQTILALRTSLESQRSRHNAAANQHVA